MTKKTVYELRCVQIVLKKIKLDGLAIIAAVLVVYFPWMIHMFLDSFLMPIYMFGCASSRL